MKSVRFESVGERGGQGGITARGIVHIGQRRGSRRGEAKQFESGHDEERSRRWGMEEEGNTTMCGKGGFR